MPAFDVLRAPAGCFRDLRFTGGMLEIVLSMQDQREIGLSHSTHSRAQSEAVASVAKMRLKLKKVL